MKLVAGTIAMVVVIVSFAFFSYYRTSLLSEELLSSLEQLQAAVEEGCPEATGAELKELKSRWERADAWWTPLMDHREIDLLDQTIIRIDQNIKQQRSEDTLVEIGAARRMVERIRDRERPLTKNIF